MSAFLVLAFASLPAILAQGVSPVAPTKSASSLSSVAEVHQLPQEEAAKGVPVHLTGVVTALSGFGKSFFVQDNTAGIAVDRAGTDTTDVHVGERIEIVGVSSAGFFAPTIISSKVILQGHSPLPVALPVTYTDLNGGAKDSQRVEAKGVIHTARMGTIFDKDTLILGLDMGGKSVKLMLQDFAGIDYAHLVDATIRVRGVASTEFNEKRQFLGVSLFVPSRNDFDLLQPANADPFAGPTLPVRKAFQFGQAPHRLKVSGIVTWQSPGHSLYIQDGVDGIEIQTASKDTLELGTSIEVAGFPAMGEYSPILEGGVFRVIGPPNPIKPQVINATEVILHDSYFNRARHDGQLVQIQGKVIESHYEGVMRTLIMGQQNEIFEATLSGASNPKGGLPNGSIVQLTGVCAVLADAEHSPTSFNILLRSEQDITVLKKASWWTPVHALWVLSALAGGMMMVILWVVVLRQRVERQTNVIRESEGRFRDLAQRDVLTGLPNRLMLDDNMTQCLARCRDNRSVAAVLTIDIDRFKQINDTYGHPMGDECLRVVASRLRNAAPETDTVARTGGEEFTLVAAGLRNREDADRIANTILDLFRDPMVLGELEIVVTVSIGCALYPADGEESQVLRKRSDQALYEAKRTGRNRVVFATQELSAKFEQTTILETAVRESLRAGSFSLAYQPVYDAAGSICRLEALLRTSEEHLAPLGPAVYVPIAESCGLILPLGRWVLQAVCRHIAAWRTAGLTVCPVAVNLSASQLLQSGFSEDVMEILDSYGLHPSVLEFELTETAAMTGFEVVAEKVGRLARAGVTFTIDDFGNGYSSLARLHQLPIKALKMDRSFVQNLEQNRDSYTVVQAMIKMAQSLDLQAVAKGVERPEQLELLRELGCDLFQGFLLGAPMPASAVAAILSPTDARVLSVAS